MRDRDRDQRIGRIVRDGEIDVPDDVDADELGVLPPVEQFEPSAADREAWKQREVHFLNGAATASDLPKIIRMTIHDLHLPKDQAKEIERRVSAAMVRYFALPRVDPLRPVPSRPRVSKGAA